MRTQVINVKFLELRIWHRFAYSEPCPLSYQLITIAIGHMQFCGSPCALLGLNLKITINSSTFDLIKYSLFICHGDAHDIKRPNLIAPSSSTSNIQSLLFAGKGHTYNANDKNGTWTSAADISLRTSAEKVSLSYVTVDFNKDTYHKNVNISVLSYLR